MIRTVTPVGGPAVWRGPELVDTPDWIVGVTSEQSAEPAAAAEFAVVGDLAPDRCRAIRAAMPTLAPVLATARRELVDGRGFTVLRGLPVDGIEPADLERRYWCLGVVMGIPVPQTTDGALLVHVRDQGLDYTDPHVRGYETRARLDYHVDGSDVVGLLCVRAARDGGISTLVSSTALHDEILAQRPDLVGLLYEQFWFDRRAGDGPESFYQLPIFGFELDHFVMYYGRSYIESAQRGPQTDTLSPEQLEAFDLIDQLANSPEFFLPMDLRPGDVQLLNNRLTMHARTDYVDWPDPDRKRDMIRLWLSLGDGRPAEMVP